MLRKIIKACQSLEEISKYDDVYATIVLKWNSDTPVNYEPSGFRPANYVFQLHEKTKGVRGGLVKTNFHAVGARIRAAEHQENYDINQSQLLRQSQPVRQSPPLLVTQPPTPPPVGTQSSQVSQSSQLSELSQPLEQLQS